MDIYIPKLKQDIVIKEFDTSNKEQYYLLIYNNKSWQISEYAYNVISLIDGKRSLVEIASALSQTMGVQFTEENIKRVFDLFLEKRGLLEGSEDNEKNNHNRSKFLWFKIPLLKTKGLRKFHFLSVLYQHNFAILATFFLTFAFFDALWEVETTSQNFRLTGVNYVLSLVLLFLCTFMHELGHASACMHYDQSPGEIGFAIYLTAPVLYTDVSCVWQIKRKQRCIVDIGGMYFEMFSLALIFIAGALFNEPTLRFSAMIGMFSFQRNLNPFIKMDGYWVVSDLLGIPNLHAVAGQSLKNGIYKLLKLKTEKPLSFKIEKKEKLLLSLYGILSSIFMFVITLSMVKMLSYIPQKLYSIFHTIEHGGANIAFLFIDSLAFLLTIVIVVRFIVSTFSSIIKPACRIILDIAKKKFHIDRPVT